MKQKWHVEMSKLDVFLWVSVKCVHFETFFFKWMNSDVEAPKDSPFFLFLQRNYTQVKALKNWASRRRPQEIQKRRMFNMQKEILQYSREGLEYINLFAVKTILNTQQPKPINMLRLPERDKKPSQW